MAVSEEADRQTGWIGAWIPKPEIATPAGIKHVFPIYTKPGHLEWNREALGGLTYVTMDCGPLRRWLWVIGGAEEAKCWWETGEGG